MMFMCLFNGSLGRISGVPLSPSISAPIRSSYNAMNFLPSPYGSRRAFSSKGSVNKQEKKNKSSSGNKLKGLFSFNNLLKAFIIFGVGFLGRWSINERLFVNVFLDYIDPIYIGFYLTFALFIVSISE